MTTDAALIGNLNLAGNAVEVSGVGLVQWLPVSALRDADSRGESMKTKLMLLVVLVGVVTAAACLARMVRAQVAPRRIEVTAKRFTYEPNEITLEKGQPVVLVIHSEDVTHGLRVRELNLNAKIEKGTPAELSFTPDKTGDFVGHCSVFCGSGHGGMTLTLHVVE
jgi:cytochrome c oxidase subunit 2